jgi:hypothetical protein
MVKRCGPPSQGWRTFLRNHAPHIAAMDLFVVPTIGFDLLYVLVDPKTRCAPSAVGRSYQVVNCECPQFGQFAEPPREESVVT